MHYLKYPLGGSKVASPQEWQIVWEEMKEKRENRERREKQKKVQNEFQRVNSRNLQTKVV